jgi:16S rRNA (cytosine967-C5)-methyltransferase
VVEAFLAAHAGFHMVPAADILERQHIGLDTGETLRLYPHRHGCDAFFAAVIERSAA